MKTRQITITVEDMVFTGNFTPEEPMVMYYKDGSGYPGSPPEFEITNIEGNHISLVELIDSFAHRINKRNDELVKTGSSNAKHFNVWEELEEYCLEKYEHQIYQNQ